MASNNNVAGVMHGERLYLAWRTAPLHFAGHQTRLHLVSSPDMGESWDWEATIYLGTDLREPMFLSINNTLYFSFFQAGTNPVDFEPLGLYRMENLAVGVWTGPDKYGHEGEVVWEIVKVNSLDFSVSEVFISTLSGEWNCLQSELLWSVRAAWRRDRPWPARHVPQCLQGRRQLGAGRLQQRHLPRGAHRSRLQF